MGRRLGMCLATRRATDGLASRESQKSQKSMVDQVNRSIEARAPFRNSFFAWTSGAVIRALASRGLFAEACGVGEEKKAAPMELSRGERGRSGGRARKARGQSPARAAPTALLHPPSPTPTACRCPHCKSGDRGRPVGPNSIGTTTASRSATIRLRQPFPDHCTTQLPSQGSIFSEPPSQFRAV